MLHSDADASRPASLLLVQIFPIFSLVAPRRPGASAPSVLTRFRGRDTSVSLPRSGRIGMAPMATRADAGVRPSLLVVDDDVHLAEQLRWALQEDHRVTVANDRVRGLAALAEVKPDLVLVDLCLPPDNVPDEGFRILNAARAAGRGTMVIMMSGLEEREAALRA